jgi:hypothetical protein
MTVTDDTTRLPGAAYAGESGRIRDAAEDIGVYLALWSMRDDAKPDAGARRSANDAMDAIDTALRELHALRSRLVGDIRKSDDAAMTRTAELLAALERDAPHAAAAGAPDAATGAPLTGRQEFLVRAHYGQGTDMEQVQADLAAGNYELDFEGLEADHGADAPPALTPWARSADQDRWTAFLTDGRMAVVERLTEGDENGDGAAFLPRISAFGKTDQEATGPVCTSAAAAAGWAEALAADGPAL